METTLEEIQLHRERLREICGDIRAYTLVTENATLDALEDAATNALDDLWDFVYERR